MLAVILVRTGYNLAKPAMILNIYKQGKEQFLPFIVTIVAMLATDLLIGVLIGIVYSLYFLIRNTYKAGYTISENVQGHTMHVHMELALNVSFLNKRKIKEALDRIPPYSIVTIDGTRSINIDHDILEIFQEFRSKARQRHLQLELKNIPEVSVIELH
ncbi:MAG: SulP family inorganic anion transporter [Bacteroidetes bacterium]|nr:SulP family inorganic anion transporter [Bacteroidota bacterium]